MSIAPRTYKKLIAQARKEVLDWYCHDNGPYPEHWAKADPWKEVLKILGVLALLLCVSTPALAKDKLDAKKSALISKELVRVEGKRHHVYHLNIFGCGYNVWTTDKRDPLSLLLPGETVYTRVYAHRVVVITAVGTVVYRTRHVGAFPITDVVKVAMTKT